MNCEKLLHVSTVSEIAVSMLDGIAMQEQGDLVNDVRNSKLKYV